MYRYLLILQYIMMYVFYFCVYTYIGSIYQYNTHVPIRFIVENKCFDLQLFDKKLDLVGIIRRPKLKMSGTCEYNRVKQETILEKNQY